MSNKRYLIGFLIYGIIYAFLAWTSLSNSLFVFDLFMFENPRGGMNIFLLTLILIPVILLGLLIREIRRKHTFWYIIWGLIFTALLLIIILFPKDLELSEVRKHLQFFFLAVGVRRLLIPGFILSPFLFVLWKTIRKFTLREYKQSLNWAWLCVVLFIGLVAVVISVVDSRARSEHSMQVADLKTIDSSLERYHIEKGEYPKSLKVIDQKPFYRAFGILDHPPISNYYNYAYGIDKDTGKVQYYHVGALFSEGRSERVESLLYAAIYLRDDQDYDSTHDTSQVDWRPDNNNPGPCLTADGFNGADDNNCGLSGRAGVYDRGVVPE